MPGIDAAVRELKARRDALAEEIQKIDQALEVLAGLGTSSAPRPKGGKWRPGGRGRPPKSYTEKQAAEKSVAKAPRRKARRGKAPRKPPTEKQLAAMAKAREALAAKRAKAAAS